MEPVYVTGHRNPDTDSIVAAIAYASLCHALGNRNYIAARIGDISDQTQLVLDKFGFEPPLLLKNVRTQVNDLSFDTPPILSGAVSVFRAYETMIREDVHSPALPVADEEGRLCGMLTMGDIAAHDMRYIEKTALERVPLFNLLAAIEGHLRADAAQTSEISGELVIALPTSHGLPEFKQSDIVVCGDQPEVIGAAIRAGVRVLSLCDAELDPALLPTLGDMCVIATPYPAYRACRLIGQSIPVERICNRDALASFHLTDYLDDVKEELVKSRFRSYPILDEADRVVGTLSRFHLIRPNRKRLVLVDHNEAAQSVPGLEQAEIIGIIDHHRLADVETASPVYVRNEPVGSTCTIIGSMFFEKGVVPSGKLAGLIASAIVSDTILFKSPTSTERDRIMAERMAKLAGVSLTALGQEMFAVSVNNTADLKELLYSDFKQFHIAGHDIGIGQITCLDSKEIASQHGALVALMEQEREKNRYDTLLLMLTDVLREGTELFAVGETETVEHAFNVRVTGNSVFLPKVMSRKKQVVPALSLLWG